MEMILRLVVAAVVAVAVGGGQFLASSAVIRTVPGDAQGAIAVVVAALAATLSGLATFILSAVTLWALARGRWNLAAALAVVLAGVLGLVGLDVANSTRLRQALLAAADPATPPQILRELATSRRGGWYEVDNRLASNPATPPEVLRMLHGRPDQVGTEICLAANPNTPDDILRDLAARSDEWAEPIRQALAGNPRAAALRGADAAVPEAPASSGSPAP